MERADPDGDHVLNALAAVIDLLDRSARRVEAIKDSAQALRSGRADGASYAELLTGAHAPLVTDMVSDVLDALLAAGSRLRRAQVRALHDEGLTLDKIGRLLRVSRQRVSVMLHNGASERLLLSTADRHRSSGLSLTDPEFRMMAESLPHIAWVSTADGAVEYFSRLGSEYTGMPPATNYGWNWLTLVHPDDRDRAEQAWRDATSEEASFDCDMRLRRFDGQYGWLRCRSIASRGPDGQVVKWVGTAIDIDDQKQLEEDLRLAEREASHQLAVLEALYSSAPIAFGLVDHESRVLRMNERLAAFNCAPMADQVGRRLAELIPDLWPQLETGLVHAREADEPAVNLRVAPLPSDRLDQGNGWLTSFYPVRRDGAILGFGLVIVDL